jgi:hypothetical protein
MPEDKKNTDEKKKMQELEAEIEAENIELEKKEVKNDKEVNAVDD